MASTYLSVLSTNTKVLESTAKVIKETRFFKGYLGSESDDLQRFIGQKQDANHLLFLKPSKDFMTVCSPVNLKKIGNVEVVILGQELPKDLIGFVQEYKIAGFVVPTELNAQMVIEINQDVEESGFHANDHIPLEYWKNKKPHLFPRPKPDLTPGEEEVLRLLCHNFNVKEICGELGKKEPAIRAHIANLREKLVAQSLMEIVVIAMANMWVKIEPTLTSSKSPFL